MTCRRLPIWVLFQPNQRPMLRRPADPIDLARLTARPMQRLIDDMISTMLAANGIGLAGPQIGQSIRLAVISREVTDRHQPLVLVNPEVNPVAGQTAEMEEGCLSIPGVYGLVPRVAAVTLESFDRHGQPYRLTAEGLLARVIQHEADHLNGHLFIDRASRITAGQELLP